MLKHLLMFLFPFVFSFAAGAPSLTEGGPAAGGESSGGDTAADYGLGEVTEVSDGTGESTEVPDGTTETGETEPTPQIKPEDKEAHDFKGQVSRRLIALKKDAPELAAIFQKYPKVQEQVEAAFRRDMAYRELYPTVAEARQMREQFPNGMQDVQQLLTDVGEIEQLDSHFYTKDREGNYPGHQTIIENMFTDDREAAVSLFKTLPKAWARLDPDSYREVMGQIVGATLARAEVPEMLHELIQSATEAKQNGLAGELKKLAGWVNRFLQGKPEPTEEERRHNQEKEQWSREKADQKREEGARFHQNFVRESRKLQNQVIGTHPAIKGLEKVQAITPEKRARIVEEVRSRIEKHLSKSTSFMRKLRAAHGQGNLQETLTLQKAQWAYPWILNKFVREVLAEETPAMIRSNRGGQQQRRAATSSQPAKPGEQKKAPFKSGNTWYYGDGTKIPMSEILRHGPPQG